MKTQHVAVASVAIAAVFACNPREIELTPAQSAAQVTGLEESATDTAAGVRLTAQVDKWEGDAIITREVTPVRLIIQNQSGRPVQIRYGDFVLTANDGTQYQAIPPFRVEGQAPNYQVVDYAPIADPMWGASAFGVAPYYSTVYPTTPAYTGVWDVDPAYYGTAAGYWYSEPLPTAEMLAWALPEGVIENGGNVNGFLYFEKVDDDKDRVDLIARLKSPGSTEPIARMQLPFEVQ